jgi:nitrate reductase beta subunit
MNVRSQISMVFHLDKCIGCHTCSIACKNIWTDRRGTEYMWWNNVETKPGTGFPTQWENQEKYRGGWELKDGKIQLKSTSKRRTVTDIFHNPSQPSMDDYYEPWPTAFSSEPTGCSKDTRDRSSMHGFSSLTVTSRSWRRKTPSRRQRTDKPRSASGGH